jgi:hypothetical protein
MVIAVVLLSLGLAFMAGVLVRQGSAADGQLGIDLADFVAAAGRLSSGESPYAREMMDGPIDAQGLDRYRYPPPLAQLLAPLSGVAHDQMVIIWLVIQSMAVYLSVWMGSGIGGARRSLERALWCGVATTWFLPVLDSLWKGNVSGFLALSSVAVALGGVAGGLGAAVGALLKVVPGTLVPVALVSDARSRWTVVLVIGSGLALGAALAPSAWSDYPTVLSNMLAGSVDYATNLAPAATADRLGLPEPLVVTVRGVTLILAVTCIGVAMWLARSRAGLPAAALLGVVAMLLLPGALWYHYLAALLPFAAVAWPRAGLGARCLLLLAAALVSLGLAWLPIVLAGASLLATAALWVIWPSGSAARGARAAIRDVPVAEPAR